MEATGVPGKPVVGFLGWKHAAVNHFNLHQVRAGMGLEHRFSRDYFN